MRVAKIVAGVGFLFVIAILFSCNSEAPEADVNEPDPVSDSIKVTLNLTNKKQEMIGFGGALTWYSNWLTTHNKANEIGDGCLGILHVQRTNVDAFHSNAPSCNRL